VFQLDEALLVFKVAADGFNDLVTQLQVMSHAIAP